jgi:hypothetical protein
VAWFDWRLFLIGLVGAAFVEYLWVMMFRSWWRARQRRIDVQILWPSCKTQAPDIDHAKAIFAVHAFHDVAWLELGGEEIIRRIEGLV